MRRQRIPRRFFLPLALLTGTLNLTAHAQTPVVDRATPHTQNGLTLLAITRGDARGMYRFPVPAGLNFLSAPTVASQPGSLALWIKSSKPLLPPKPGQPMMPGMPGGSMVNSTMQLQAQMVNGYGGNGPQTPLYVLFVPGSYGPQTHGLEASFTDGRGHMAMWKIDNLPPPYHAVPPSTPLKSAFVRPGVMLKAIAWRDNGKRGQFSTPLQGIDYRITATTGAGPGWVVYVQRALLEWEGASPAPLMQNRFGGFYSSPPFFGARGMPHGSGSYIAAQGTQPTPYGSDNHRLRLDCNLIRLATASETLTFHNLKVRPYTPPTPPQFRGRGPRMHGYTPPASNMISVAHPQTITTPSGISVTLLPLSDMPPSGSFFEGFPSSVSLLLRFNGPAPNMMMPVSLPRSPLARMYHKPVMLALTKASPLMLQDSFPIGGYGLPGQNNSPKEFIVTVMPSFHPPVFRPQKGHPYVYMQPTAPKFLPSLTLTLTQTTQLQSQPVSFVLAIGNTPPPMPGMPPPPRTLRR